MPSDVLKVQITVVRGSVGFVSVPVALRDITEGVRDSVIVIQSNGPISVKACNREFYNIDGLTIYPTDVLTNSYMTVNAPNYYSIIQVVTWAPGVTQVDITCPMVFTTMGNRIRAGQKYTQYLQQYQVLVVYLTGTQDNLDLTNCNILASQTVAAFSANQLACIYGTGDHAWEQLMPLTSWGTQFALVGTPKRTAGDYFKITAATSVTLTFTPSLFGDPTSASPSSFAWVFQASGTYRTLTTSAPVQVYLYATSQASNEANGDPSSTLIPPINQYVSAYQFSTFSGNIIIF